MCEYNMKFYSETWINDGLFSLVLRNICVLIIMGMKFHYCRYRLSFGCNDKLQLGSVVASFTRARSAMVAAAA